MKTKLLRCCPHMFDILHLCRFLYDYKNLIIWFSIYKDFILPTETKYAWKYFYE